MDFFLADDLSGALDAAAAFHHAGRRVRVVLSAGAWSRRADDEVVGVTTETRNAGPADAASAVARAITHASAQGARLVYKKIDSTLRGPVAAEVGALAAAWPEARILFCPANPGAGRTVRDGVLLVRGVPVAESEFARDPVTPVKESSIPRLLGAAAAGRMVIADAVTEDDLVAAVARMDAVDTPWVGVGSGALARPVAARGSEDGGRGAEDGGRKTGDGGRGAEDGGRKTEDGGRRTEGTRSETAGVPDSACPSSALRPLSSEFSHPPSVLRLLICGSAHPGNREQAAVLARERGVPVHELRLDAPADAVKFVRESFAVRRGAALLIERRRGESDAVVRMIAQTAAAILAETGVRRVFVTGGETAFALCRALDVTGLTFCEEIEAGLSVSRAERAGVAELFAIKPGGFGDARTWIRAWDALAAI